MTGRRIEIPELISDLARHIGQNPVFPVTSCARKLRHHRFLRRPSIFKMCGCGADSPNRKRYRSIQKKTVHHERLNPRTLAPDTGQSFWFSVTRQQASGSPQAQSETRQLGFYRELN